MHKNIPVVDLAIDTDSGIIEKIGQIHNPAHLPVGTTWVSGPDNGKPERRKLNDWWVGRSIPASRENIQSALMQMNLLQTTELLSKCYGLSLSDQYWICPLDSSLKWVDINFFDNPFSGDVGDILFGHEPSDAEQVNLMSPDNTSDGWLRKKWLVADGKRLLMKGGSGPYQQEPLQESRTHTPPGCQSQADMWQHPLACHNPVYFRQFHHRLNRQSVTTDLVQGQIANARKKFSYFSYLTERSHVTPVFYLATAQIYSL